MSDGQVGKWAGGWMGGGWAGGAVVVVGWVCIGGGVAGCGMWGAGRGDVDVCWGVVLRLDMSGRWLV